MPSVLPLLILVCLAVPGVTASATEKKASRHPRPFRIGIIGDQTLSPDVQASYKVLQQGVQVLSEQHLDVVLHCGDMVESSLGPDQVTALYNQAVGILDKLPVPWYLTAGDHDVNPPVFEQGSPDHSREQLFQQLYGARVPAFASHPWYSFDLQGVHFISLYSFGALWSDSRFGNIFLSRLFNDQFDFLKADLAAHAHARAILVWVHQPLWYHASGWKRVHELLRNYPVVAVISGHFHYNQDGGTVDGVHYFTVGATGGSKKNGNRQAGNVDHVSVLTVSGEKNVSMKLLALDNQPLNLTPREDMDRVQALDVQLGNFFDFAQLNPVFSKAGRLVSDCSSAKPAVIQVNEIGDPIDLPLDVKINLSSLGVALNGASFPAGQCQQIVSDVECVLKPTARTFSSNYSGDNINTTAGPLWTSGLSGTAQPATVLNFNIRTSFTGDSGEFFLDKAVSTTVQNCP